MSLLRALLLSTFCLFVAPLHAQSLDSLTGTPPASEGETKSAQPSLDEQTRRMSEQAATSETRLAELKAQLAQAPKVITEDRKSVVQGRSVSVRVDIGGRRVIKKKK